MRKVSRRTDCLIVAVLLAICILILVSSLQPEKTSSGDFQIVTPESYNGKKLGTMAGSQYVKILQGVPMVVLLLTLYYVVFNKSELGAVWIAVAGFTLHFGAYCSETLRSGINSVPSGQREAALALGHTESQAFIHFILPQAVRNVLPVYRGRKSYHC